MSTPEALSNNEASGVPKTHAANSRPEIELKPLEELLNYCSVPTAERRSILALTQSLIAQEAEKLAKAAWSKGYHAGRAAELDKGDSQ